MPDLFSTALSAPEVLSLFQNVRFRFVSEVSLQDGIEQVLRRSGVPHIREEALSPADRPDFMIAENIALEIKTKGSIAQAIRQVHRYAQHETVHAIILMGTPHWLPSIPPIIGGKPVFIFRLTGSLL